MDFTFDARTEGPRAELHSFLDSHVYPAAPVFHQQLAEQENRWAWSGVPVLAELRREAKSRGLWNLFLPGEGGAGLTNLQYAPLAEITGRSLHLAPPALNCAAPDTGTMELLAPFGPAEQRERWLEPLLDGAIRSSFAMTEPDVASSDATNIATRIEREDDDYVINGRKWWISGAADERCKVFIVMGKTDPDAEPHRRQSMVLVPRNTKGLTIERHLPIFGYQDQHGHSQLSFKDVRVPVANILS